tara:strand:- start:2023 stop:2400 length:378 start_codon:yes stop_codon:yes gene_type:complete
MNNKTILGTTIIFIITVIVFITSSSLNSDNFGDSFIVQIRISDSEKTLEDISDEILIQVGKDICNSSSEWKDEQESLNVIFNLLKKYEIEVDISDRIIPILRFQSTYELCPENITVLDSLFKNAK